MDSPFSPSIVLFFFWCTFIKHPDDDEAVLVAGGELLVRLVPTDHLNLSIVSLQRLVHGQVGGRRQTLHLPILSRLELVIRRVIRHDQPWFLY